MERVCIHYNTRRKPSKGEGQGVATKSRVTDGSFFVPLFSRTFHSFPLLSPRTKRSEKRGEACPDGGVVLCKLLSWLLCLYCHLSHTLNPLQKVSQIQCFTL